MTSTVLDRLVEHRPPEAPGRRWLAAHGWPGPRDEAWRYAPLAAIEATAAAADVAPAAVGLLLAGLPPGPRIVVVDGELRSDLSILPAADGLTVETGAEAGPLPADTDGFAAANHASASGTTRIRLDDGAASVHLVHVAADRPAAHPRVEVSVAPGARLELIETFRAAPGAHLTNAVTRVAVGEGAHLVHARVVQSATGAAHVGRTEIVLAERATVRAAALTAGPGAIRRTMVASIEGRDANIGLTGVCAPAAGAHHDSTVSMRHGEPGATSRQQHVAIVPDGGRSSFTGHILVAAGAAGTDADLQNRNLLLGPAARADTRPWLQIDTDDVACTHGAAVGRLDDDALFYLRSRGIPEQAARAMLVAAFAEAALDEALPAGPARVWLHAAAASAIDAVLDGDAAELAGEVGPP